MIGVHRCSSVQIKKEVFAFKYGNQVKVKKLKNLTDGMSMKKEDTLYEELQNFTVSVYCANQYPTIFLVGGKNYSGKGSRSMFAFT